MRDICIYCGKEKEGDYDDVIDEDFINKDEDFEFICNDCNKKDAGKEEKRLKLVRRLFK